MDNTFSPKKLRVYAQNMSRGPPKRRARQVFCSPPLKTPLPINCFEDTMKVCKRRNFSMYAKLRTFFSFSKICIYFLKLLHKNKKPVKILTVAVACYVAADLTFRAANSQQWVAASFKWRSSSLSSTDQRCGLSWDKGKVQVKHRFLRLHCLNGNQLWIRRLALERSSCGTIKLVARGMRPVRFWAHSSDFVTPRPFLMRLVWSAFE